MTFLKKFFVEEDGQDMVEYGLVLALVVAVGLAGLTVLGPQVTKAFTTATTAIAAAL